MARIKTSSSQRNAELREQIRRWRHLHISQDPMTLTWTVSTWIKGDDGTGRTHRLREGFATRRQAHQWRQADEARQMAIAAREEGNQ